jgi:hypothetical protein
MWVGIYLMAIPCLMILKKVINYNGYMQSIG